ncbi:MAG: hypothetical protein FWC57_00905 [Endomicrobia bacterium]|nr:hypothetical protein [Endomicrobiia bacterium]
MKKLTLLLLVFAAFIVFFSACDSADSTDPYKSWTIGLASYTLSGSTVSELQNPVSISATQVISIDAIIKDANGQQQTSSNITWTAYITGIGPVNSKFISFSSANNRININMIVTTSSGTIDFLAHPNDNLVVTAYFANISTSTTITFTN